MLRAHSRTLINPRPCPSLTRAQDVCRMMAEKIGFSDPEDDALCFCLCECLDGVSSA